MALTLAQFKQQNPEYAQVEDGVLADHLHQKYYSDMDPGSFYKEIGYEDPNADGDFSRQFKNTFKQLPQTGYGLAAGAAATAESALGNGGYSTDLKNFAVDKLKTGEQSLSETAKESDSLTYSLDAAKQGDYGALMDWVQGSAGYAAGQGLQLLATGGLGGVAAKVGGNIALKGVVERMVAKETAKLAAEGSLKKLTMAELTSAATANVANKLSSMGSGAAVGAYSFGSEGGEIGGDLAKQSVDRGTPLTGDEIKTGLGSTAVAGGLESAGNLIGLDVLKGKSALLKGFESKPGILGKVARGGVAALGAAPIEAGTEYGQTLAEQYGGGHDPFSDESLKQAFDAAGQGAVGGAVMAAGGGAMSSPRPVKTPEQKDAETNERILNPDASIDDSIAAMTDSLSAGTSQSAGVNAGINAGEYEQTFQDAANRYGIPVDFLKAVAQQESGMRQFDKNGNPANPGTSTAIGMMQIIPRWHPEFDPHKLAGDAEYNINAGAKFIADLMREHDGDLSAVAKRYYGSNDASANQKYADSVLGKMSGEIPVHQPFSAQPRYNNIPDAEAIVQNRTIPGKGILASINDQFSPTNYQPGEQGQVWEQPAATITKLDQPITDQLNNARQEQPGLSVTDNRSPTELNDANAVPIGGIADAAQSNGVANDLPNEPQQALGSSDSALTDQALPLTIGENVTVNSTGKVGEVIVTDRARGARVKSADGTVSNWVPIDSLTRVDEIDGKQDESKNDNAAATLPERRDDNSSGAPMRPGGTVSGNDSNLSESQQASIQPENGGDNTGPTTDALNPIITKTKGAYLLSKALEFKRENPKAIEAAKKQNAEKVKAGYEDDLNRALAAAPFDVYAKHPSNKTVKSDSILRQSHEALRQEYGITGAQENNESNRTQNTETSKAAVSTQAEGGLRQNEQATETAAIPLDAGANTSVNVTPSDSVKERPEVLNTEEKINLNNSVGVRLRASSHDIEGKNDVLLSNDRFVSLNDAAKHVNDAIALGMLDNAPAQLNLQLGIAMRDAKRVIAYAKQIGKQDITQPTETKASPDNSESQLNKDQGNQQYHPAIKSFADELVEGGGISYTYDGNGKINGRTPSVNPSWFKDGAFVVLNKKGQQYSKAPSVREIKQAVADHQNGKEITDKQHRILSTLSGIAAAEEEFANQQFSGEQLDYARDLEAGIISGAIDTEELHEANSPEQFDTLLSKAQTLTGKAALDALDAFFGESTNGTDRQAENGSVNDTQETSPEGLSSYTETELEARAGEQKQRDKQAAADELKAEQKRKADNEIDTVADEMFGNIGTNDLFSDNPLADLGRAEKAKDSDIKSSQSQQSVENPHTEQSLTKALRNALDTKFGDGWFSRLLDTGKFKVISHDEARALIGGQVKFHKVWHGSPHDHDKFDSSKIGTGEGAQAFGYGHYFTDEKDIAEYYKRSLAGSAYLVDGEEAISSGGESIIYNAAMNNKLDEHIEYLNDELREYESREKAGEVSDGLKFWGDSVKTDLELAESLIGKTVSKPGKLYEVELSPAQQEYLDWDKQLSEQSESVKNALELLKAESDGIYDLYNESLQSFENSNGGAIYRALANDSGSAQSASRDLHRFGIRGIRYKAEGGKSDANNYVIFDDNDIKIEAKYSKNGDILAFYNPANDTSYFVHDNISKDTSAKALYGLMMHEVGVHQLQLLRNDKEFQAILKRVKMMSRGGNKFIAYGVERALNAFDIKTIPTKDSPQGVSPELFWEEVLSYSIENQPTHSITQKLIQLVRKALRLIGRALPMLERGKWIRWANTLNEGDIISMATSALRQAPDALMFDNQSSDNAIRLAQEKGYKGNDKGESQEWLRAVAKGLDMSKKARMARANDMGFSTKVWHHATASNINFDSEGFDTSRGDLGAHFGNINQAFHVMEHRNSAQGRIIDVLLAVKNPIRLKDIGSFHADRIASQLESKGLLEKGEGKRIEKEIDENWRLRKKYDPYFIDVIKDAGYDGVIYKNTNEGAGDSIIVFDANQIRSINAAFDPDYKDSSNLLASFAGQNAKTTDNPLSVDTNRNAANDRLDSDMDTWAGSAYDYEKNGGDKAGMSNKKLEALVAQYAGVDGKPSREQLKEAVGQYRTIEVLNFNRDGSPKPRAMLAPNGKPTNLNESQWIQVRTENFKRWFGDSKVLDENGEPLVIKNGDEELFINDKGQEKSATINTGTFKPNSNDIRFSRANLITNVSKQGDDWLKSFLSQERKDSVIYNLQDRFIDLKRKMEDVVKNGGIISEENNPYLAEELYHQRTASRIKDFYDHEIKPILHGLHHNAIGIDEFQTFLHARHAPSRNAVMAERNPNQEMIDANLAESEANLESVRSDPLSTRKEIGDALAEYNKWNRAKPFNGNEEDRLSLSGMSDEDSADIIDNLTPKQRAIMEPLADKVDAINNKTLDLLVEYGMETKDSVKALKDQWEHYVPLHRDEAHPDDNTFGHPVGRGFSVRGSGIKNATGSNAEVTNILAHITAAREQMLRRGEKNKVTVALANFIKANPDGDFAEINKIDMEKALNDDGLVDTRMEPIFKRNMADNVVMFRTDGKDQAIVFNKDKIENVRLAMSLKNLDGANLDTVESLIAKGTRWFSKVNTQYNVIFGIVNLIRDTQGMALNLTNTDLHGKQGEVFRNMGGAFKAIAGGERDNHNIDPTLKAMYDRFNKAGGTTGYAQMFEDIQDRNKALEDEIKKLSAPKPMQLARAGAKLLSDFNALMENSTRLAVFMAAVDSGLSDAKAASIAKNITVNFNRKGAQSTKIGAFYAFFNASAQGTARLVETMTGPQGKQIMASGVALGAITTLIGLAMMGDDEWEKIPEFVRERSLIIPTGKSDYIAIPMPLGFHLIPNIGRKVVEAAFGSDRVSKTKRLAQLAGSTVGAFNPLGGSDISEFVMPTVLDPALALWRNKDYTGRSIYKEDFNSQRPTPGFTRSKDTASTFSKLVAEGINKTTGGTDYKQGAWSPTPDQIDFVLGQLSGGTGRELLKAEETVTGTLKGEEVPMYKIPLLGRLAGETSGNAAERSAYYDNLKLLNEHKAEIDGLKKEGQGAEALRYIKKNPEAALLTKAKAIEKAIDKLSDRRKLMVKKDSPVAGIDKAIANQMKQLNDAVAQRI